MNNRQKEMGYNPTQELMSRLGMDMDSNEIVKNYDEF
jgi:hypothetical protein